MSSIFLSHTSFDKPFVEKLANDLTRLGINVWFDKWEIKVGESLFWKIEEGIRANEYLGIILSPQALTSEWVRSELGAAFAKQIRGKKIVVLPILYQDCDIPLLFQDRKYANFKNDYNEGLCELANVFGIKNTAVISVNNWRNFKRDKSVNWKIYRENKFELIVTKLVDHATEYNWSSWVGAKTSYSITLRAFIDQHKEKAISIKLDGKTNAYWATMESTWNPNHFKSSDFNIYVGNTINEVEEFVWRQMEDFKKAYGNPVEKGTNHTYKFLSNDEKMDVINMLTQKMNWYKGTQVP
ncbi:hypothetical protein QF042_004644 [Pedobacter sp. W3I1]|uniref:toll/interleukin-1 receptor domain-containing protein n=1 Tax=Pedobacter sp. W3I1 TaxID=3042291 RepID=UPI002784C191|nr:toll/interleukin-1 receptor domain-containing protein [Pedobacter sp. W3I1]MDQ0641079.1 hypothetical protein [Pedobacter sp. W3I1]